ncbi:PREDICTED: cathepsin L1-like [Chrysochloris asiatica]|uniref:Cathepsin L1-like n=1 Tax=Chrysochloris asiatica TaxID=185453 RepID=A0A9B0WSY9_CHRAS|nr:PREDICTED: cathepsin L1-like [Chrysochloris asiatica]
MNPSLFLAALCMGIASVALKHDQTLDTEWYQWKSTHKKLYGMNEDSWRRAVWEKNVKMIELHNREYSLGKHNFTMAINAFGDMTNEEFRRIMSGIQIKKHNEKGIFHERSSGDIPKSVDWRKKGYVTPVKAQGHCGSCWAFSATGALEGQMFRKTGKLVSLSEQNLVDCARQGNYGCNGGYMNNAFQYVKNNRGLDSEKGYPYTATDHNVCHYKPEYSAANVTGIVNIPHNEGALMEAVARVGPIAVCIDATQDSFRFYRSGIYSDPKCRHNLNHAVLVVGYGFEGPESDNNKYWLIKNSWSSSWGLHGYIKVAKDRNLCGITDLASYPTV